MNKMLLVFMILLISGCVQQSTKVELTPEQISAKALKSAEIHTELAAAYYNRKQYKVAVEEVTEALQADSNYTPAYNVKGLIYMALNEDELAQENFKRALNISPKDSEVLNNYGWFLCQHMPERMEQAIKFFMLALRDPLYSTPEKPYTNAGVCEIKRSNYKDALAFFHNALAIRQSYPPALVGLIEVDFRNGNTAIAKSKLSDHMQHHAPTVNSLWLAIQIARKTGERRAEDSYTFQLEKRFPDSKEAAALRQGRLK